MTTWTARPSLAPGEYPDGAEYETLLDQVDTLTAAGWTSFTTAPSGGSAFTWTGASSNPSAGNATITAVYRKPLYTDLIHILFKITMGSTTTYGSGVWFFSLPFTATSTAVGCSIGSAHTLNFGTAEYSGTVRLEDTGKVRIVGAGVASWEPTVPHTFGNQDTLSGYYSYEPA